MGLKKIYYLGIMGISFFCVMANASANVAFQSTDNGSGGWNYLDDEQDFNTIFEWDCYREHGFNQWCLEIQSENGKTGYITSSLITPFDKDDEYWVQFEFKPGTGSFDDFYVCLIEKIALLVYTESSQHILKSRHCTGFTTIGTLNADWNLITIHANTMSPPFDYQCKLNGGNWVACSFGSYDNGNMLLLGDNDLYYSGIPPPNPNEAQGHAYWDSIKIWHGSEEPVMWLMNYDLLDDFARGYSWQSGLSIDNYFWNKWDDGYATVHLSGWENKDDWDDTFTTIYLNTHEYSKDWAKSIEYDYDGANDAYDIYIISFQFYLDSAENNQFTLMYNGEVNLHITDNILSYQAYPSTNYFVKTLNIDVWYRIMIFVDHANGYYCIALNNQILTNIPGAGTQYGWGYQAEIPTYFPGHFNYLDMGTDSDSFAHYGEVWYDDIRVDYYIPYS